MLSDKNYNWTDKLFLIVEDDPASLMLLEIILSKTGAKMLFAETGEVAVGIFKKTRGIDLVLMDIKLAGMNGFQATTLIKQLSPNTPVIAQTACVVYGDKERCIQSGCSAYIPKPIISDLLLETIQTQLNSKVSCESFQVSSYSN